MDADQPITTGEIARSLARLELSLGRVEMLTDEIRVQVTRTNGRVNGHDREIKELKDTVSRALWWLLGINATIIAGAALYALTHGK